MKSIQSMGCFTILALLSFSSVAQNESDILEKVAVEGSHHLVTNNKKESSGIYERKYGWSCDARPGEAHIYNCRVGYLAAASNQEREVYVENYACFPNQYSKSLNNPAPAPSMPYSCKSMGSSVEGTVPESKIKEMGGEKAFLEKVLETPTPVVEGLLQSP